LAIDILKILITAPWFTESYLSKLREDFIVDVNPNERWYKEEELMEIIGRYDGIIAGLDPFTDKVLQNASKLRVIARRGIGYDKINLDTCRMKNIILTNTPVPQEHEAVAEFTVGVILAITRNIASSSVSLKSESWQRYRFLGIGLKDMTIGILGLGNIGLRVANILKSLGSTIIYSDPFVKNDSFARVDIKELFMNSNLVSIHIPKNADTVGLIDKSLLSLMKKGSYLVDTARAEVLNMTDLETFVKNGTIASVALDVFPTEPPNDFVFIRDSRVLATPHIAAFTRSSFDSIDSVCYTNIVNVLLKRKEPKYRII
jgi:D-3-phosphoglycerate dehydrogenase